MNECSLKFDFNLFIVTILFMINNLNYKLDLLETNLELKSSLELQVYLLDAKEHLLDVWGDLTPEEEVSLTKKIEKIEKYLQK
ncbi:MAG: hypothetical protein Q7T77_09840 [Sulfuricurvum sp.]|nr:hypothetical protein [Sulfuricurvum sp.]